MPRVRYLGRGKQTSNGDEVADNVGNRMEAGMGWSGALGVTGGIR